MPTSSLPESWLELPAYQRDLLLTLVIDGPGSGKELHERVGGGDGRKRGPTTYRHLADLRDADLVKSEPGMGHDNTYAATTHGLVLVDALVESLGGR
jgi:hypothetical protein